MKCPYCGSPDTRVINSRIFQDGLGIRRRRICNTCSRRFTTYEYIEKIPILVIKRNNRGREPFDRNKLLRGIMTACRKRPVSIEKMEWIVNKIQNRLIDEGKREVSAEEIGEMVLEYLLKIDPVSYIRFASVYRYFETADEFIKLLKEMEHKKDAQESMG